MKMYQLTRVSGKDEYRIQGTKVSSIKYRSELPYRTVFLSPFDMNLLYFAPSLRRDYIDSILSRTYAQFPQVRREYERIMRQRNALLKKIREGEAKKDDLDFWDKKFSEVASQYREYRMSYVDFVQDHFHIIQNFLPKYTLSFRYSSKIFSKSPLDEILAYLSLNRDRDILSGHTHIGPHLDDFSFVIGSGSTYDSPL
jgi:DNA replication and repair protein RecF